MTMPSHRSRLPAPRRTGFTLVELLVVIAVIALLAGLLLPALRSVRHGTRVSQCLLNLRSLERAHLTYAESHRGFLADARLSHGGVDQGQGESFVETLLPFLDGQAAVMRSPLDESPHWPAEAGGRGVPVPGSNGAFRRTSYGINNHLAREFSAWGAIDPARVTDRISSVRNPACTVHTLCMAQEGEFAGADHPHVEEWGGSPQAATIAATQVGTGWAAGRPGTADAQGNYAFADGHASSEIFARLYRDETANAFDPAIAGTFRP
jgi:prepilin-type N-terminal cleavage/methylation domain-containing protein/prepilin-type processing-associated H-X9-DG protein